MKTNEFPYKNFESFPAWDVVEKTIGDLVSNGDLDEKTARKYVVGSIIESMFRKNMLSADAIKKSKKI